MAQRAADCQVLSLDAPEPGGARPGTSSGRKKAAGARASDFRRFLERDELPLAVSAPRADGSRRVAWRSGGAGDAPAAAEAELAHWLPLCLGGLQDAAEPVPALAFDASMALLERALSEAAPLRAALPAAVAQLRAALGTREPAAAHRALLVLQQLAVCAGAGLALADHYRALLPLCNLLQDAHLGTGDERTRALVADALETLEAFGPPDAHKLIQQYVPTYQRSC